MVRLHSHAMAQVPRSDTDSGSISISAHDQTCAPWPHPGTGSAGHWCLRCAQHARSPQTGARTCPWTGPGGPAAHAPAHRGHKHLTQRQELGHGLLSMVTLLHASACVAAGFPRPRCLPSQQTSSWPGRPTAQTPAVALRSNSHGLPWVCCGCVTRLCHAKHSSRCRHQGRRARAGSHIGVVILQGPAHFDGGVIVGVTNDDVQPICHSLQAARLGLSSVQELSS